MWKLLILVLIALLFFKNKENYWINIPQGSQPFFRGKIDIKDQPVFEDYKNIKLFQERI